MTTAWGSGAQVDSTLNIQQRRDAKHREQLYQEWKEGVYDPIHSQLKAKVSHLLPSAVCV
jgi:hypothetical protein